jgi:hypothetical protein
MSETGPIAFTIRSPYLPHTVFEGRSCEYVPADNTVALMYRRNDTGYIKAGVGHFKDGRWLRGNTRRPFAHTVGLYWVRIVHERPE